ncbi:YbhN family protein [Halovenus rubra]|uniref:YbhN family protein n=2 Tax=Halovenus rubra TaxID=869890 RepID=A0ABD5X2Y1_9EURY|nr:lysylphosphatidylglycerol synthase transmembrane domain-containing protein [Halovenus rubra]
MEIRRRHVAAGVLTWVAVFAVFILLAGPTEFVDAATNLSQARLAGILVMNALGTISMGLTLYTVSRGAGLNVSPIESVFLNTTVNLANNFTPFGQASGLPAGGVIMSRWTGQSFEKSVAALSTKELVGFTPGILIMLFGGSYIALFDATIPERIRSPVTVFTVSIAAFVLVLALIYRNPDPAHRVIHWVVTKLNHGIGYVPRLSKVEEDEIQRRVDGFSDSIEEISTNKPVVIVAATLTTFATVTQGVLLWIALGGVNVDISLALVVFIVPVSLLASAIPTPGGSGGIEAAQIGLIFAMTGGQRATIITAVVITRGIIYWTPIAVGSLTLAGIQFKKWWLA